MAETEATEADWEDGWYGEEVATFGDRLAAAREIADMSQAKFAKRLGVKKSSLQAWEDDLSEPRANKLSMMAGVLNVSLVWLLTGEGDGPEGPDEALDHDIKSILGEIRSIKADMRQATDKLARLEKRLRNKLD